MKIDGVTMPQMHIEVSYFNKEKTAENEEGPTIIYPIALGKRNIVFTSKGMSKTGMATLLTAIVGKSTVVISEYNDPKTNTTLETGTFRPTTPTGKEIIRNNGVLVGWESIQFTAVEI